MQKCITLSTTEAELNALFNATKHALYLHKHQADFFLDSDTVIRLYNDNQSALALLVNGLPNYHGCMKHYDIKAQHLCEATSARAIEVHYCPTNNMCTNLLTKALPLAKVNYLRSLLGLGHSSIFD
jgi:ribonuclease HI